MVYMIIAVITFAVALVGAIIKAIWFRVEYAQESVTMRNGVVKLDKLGSPIVKTSGWRCQVPVRDHQRVVNCEKMTSQLTAQSIMAGDGKNEINLTVDWHVLSRRDGTRFCHYPVRTLMVNDLNQKVEEVCRDAVRIVMATSETPASQWESKDLYKAMKPRVKKKLEKIGVCFDDVMLPNASRSEAQVQGDLIREAGVAISEALFGVVSSETPTEPSLSAVPS